MGLHSCQQGQRGLTTEARKLHGPKAHSPDRLLGNWSGKTPLGLMTQPCLLAGWFAAESHYVALV